MKGENANKRNSITFEEKKKLMDPTFASTSKSPKNFTSENSKYTTKYVY